MQYATDPNSAFRAYPPEKLRLIYGHHFSRIFQVSFFSEEHLQVVHHHSPPAALLGHILKRFSRWVSPASAASNSSSEIWQVGKMEFCQLWIFWELHQVDCLSMSHP